MQNIYYPKKLHDEVARIKKEYESTLDGTQIIKERVEQIILRIVGCSDEDELRFLALTFTKAELKAVAMYTKNNYLHVDLNKVISIFTIVKSFDCFKIVYDIWQINYTNPYSYDIISKLINCYRDEIKSSFEINNVDIIAEWMSSENADVLIGREMTRQSSSIDIFNINLSKYKLNRRYALYRNIQAEFLCSCDSKIYLDMGDDVLYETMSALNMEYQRSIMFNFLRFVDANMFSRFETVAEHAHDRLFGDPADSTYKKYMANQPEQVKKAYEYLINVFWLIKLFGRDRRSRFWKKYIKDFTVRYYASHDMLLMEFRRCVVIEFKEVGPAYFFDKEFFEKNYIRYRISKKTIDFKWDLKNLKEYLYRKEHRGYWESDMIYQLEKFAL